MDDHRSRPYELSKLWNTSTTAMTVSGDKTPVQIAADVRRRLVQTGVELYQKTKEAYAQQDREIETRKVFVKTFTDTDPAWRVSGDLNDAASTIKLNLPYSREEAYGGIDGFYSDSKVDVSLKNVHASDALEIVKLLKERREARNR